MKHGDRASFKGVPVMLIKACSGGCWIVSLLGYLTCQKDGATFLLDPYTNLFVAGKDLEAECSQSPS
jgi:hypothetical protein